MDALGGLRVLDLSRGCSGALVSQCLADYGAEVIHIESPEGDDLWEQPAYYFWQRGKKSVSLDLSSEAGRTSARRLAESTDILIETYRPGVAERMDREGFVTLVGRRAEFYISGGENVYPAEVERVLEAHPGIAAAAVVGRPDREWGEAGDAYVVPLDEDLDPEELLQFAAQRLARYKLPRSVRFLDELPRTAAGKIRKHALPAAPSN